MIATTTSRGAGVRLLVGQVLVPGSLVMAPQPWTTDDWPPPGPGETVSTGDSDHGEVHHSEETAAR